MDIIAFITGLILLVIGRNLLRALYYTVEGLKSSGKDSTSKERLFTILVNLYAAVAVGYLGIFLGIAVLKVLELI